MRHDLAWRGTTLVVGDHLRGRVTRDYLSPSTASALGSCPARYAAERVTPSTEGAFDATTLGSAAHLVLERTMNLPAPARTLRSARTILSEITLEAAGSAETPPDAAAADHPILRETLPRHHWLAAVWRRTRGLWTVEDPSMVMVRRTEWALGSRDPDAVGPLGADAGSTGPIAIDGVPFVGVIDRADITGDEFRAGTTITDYKTGRASPVPPLDRSGTPRWNDDQGDQLRLYALAVTAIDGRAPLGASITYTKVAKRRHVSLAGSAMEATTERFGAAWEVMRDSADEMAFATRASGLCPWCPLIASCPTAAAAGRTEPTPRLGPGIEVPTLSVISAPGAPAAPEPDDDTGADDDATTAGPIDPAPPEPDDDATAGPTDTATAGLDDDDDAARPIDTAPPTDTPRPTDEEPATMATTSKLIEDKPWEATGRTGAMNPTSYAAGAAFGLTTLAAKCLNRADQRLDRASVRALAQTFAVVVGDVQAEWTGRADLQAGMHTRLRSALYETVATLPLPFGGTAEEWDDWVEGATRRLHAISAIAHDIFTNEPPTSPWLALADDADAADAATDADAASDDADTDDADPYEDSPV